MTRNETRLILNRICKLYYTQARRMTNGDKANMLETWAEEFRNESYEDVNRAVSIYAKSGKPFMPNAPDIIQELIAMEDSETGRLFEKLEKAAEMAANPVKHVVIDDLGGIRWNEEKQRPVYYPAEAHYAYEYTQADFAELPPELQEYAEDIEGLKRLRREMESNRAWSRQRFADALPRLKGTAS